jgi:signal peptidase I
MEPGVSTGDIVVAQTYSQEEIRNGAVKVGNVTLAKNPDKPDTLVTHRVIEILPNGDFKTKGDANRTADSTPVPRENVIGVERLLVPYLGLPIQTLRAGNPVPMAVFTLLTLLAQCIVFKDYQNDRAWAKKLREDSTENGEEQKPKSPKNRGKTVAKVASTAVAAVAVSTLTASLLPAVMQHGVSQAAFSYSLANTTSSFNASADWTPPTVTMQAPASPLKGTVSLTANAADSGTGIKNTVLQYQSVGSSSWVTLCTVATAPYTCAWNTTTVADGNYDLRAITTDNAAFSTSSAAVRTTVANNMLVVMSEVAENVRGTLPLYTTLYNTGTVNYTVRVEYAPSGTTNWKNICTGLTSPYTCSWNTTTFTNGDYDIRSVAVSGGTTFTSQTAAVTVDNLAPTVSLVDPTTPISGNWTFAANASDAHSGVESVTIQYAVSGTTNYVNLCMFTTTPYSCRVDTKTIPNGTYTLRAIAVDAAGNTTISALVTNRVIDNTISSVSMEDPGAYLTGSVTLTAAANSTAGVANVMIQRAPAGTGTWTTVCTVAAAPYTCVWNSATVTNGSYDFRAVLTDSKGEITNSVLMGARQVDNVALRGFDFQTGVGTGTAGKPDQGDVLVFTYSNRVNLGSVTTGWTGAALPVTVRLRDGGLVGTGSSIDALDVQRTGGTVNLGSVNLRQNYVKNNKTVTFNATMTATTVTVNGIQATQVTVTLGTAASGANMLRSVSSTATMIWTPSAAVMDLNGTVTSVAPVNESGTLDRDF